MSSRGDVCEQVDVNVGIAEFRDLMRAVSIHIKGRKFRVKKTEEVKLTVHKATTVMPEIWWQTLRAISKDFRRSLLPMTIGKR